MTVCARGAGGTGFECVVLHVLRSTGHGVMCLYLCFLSASAHTKQLSVLMCLDSREESESVLGTQCTPHSLLLPVMYS